MHEAIELYFNNNEVLPPDTDITLELRQFLWWWSAFKETNPGWIPYRTEWPIYDEDVGILGCIDMVLSYQGSDKHLILLDWKRCKEIKTKNKWDNGLDMFNHLPDCNFTKYSIQLNCYKNMLESKYDKSVSAMFIVSFHPEYETGQIFTVPDMNISLTDMVAGSKIDV
jgi:hypothetical protein